MNVYIRDTLSMKAAPVREAEAFRAAHPKGKFVYFDADTGIKIPDDKVEKTPPPPPPEVDIVDVELTPEDEDGQRTDNDNASE